MKQTFLLFLVLTIASYTATAQDLTVCASGCDHTTIAAAITAASAGNVIEIQDATHTEDAITINKNLTIQGQGQTTTTVQAAATQAAADDGVFIVNAGLTVTFQNLTIQNGNARASGNDDGGGVYITCNTSTNVTFTNVTITNNRADDDGGGLFMINNGGTVTLINCVISNNEANTSGSDASGGGISNQGTNNFTLTRCTVTGNSAGFSGGGIHDDKFNSINKFINCTIANNTTGGGGSFALGGGLTLTSAASCDLINCTIVENTLTTAGFRRGGGIQHVSGSLNLTNTIVANNSGASTAGNGNDIFAGAFGVTITQTTSLVEDCDEDGGSCTTFSYTSSAGIATSTSTCGVQSYFDITGSAAVDNGTAPSGDIPIDDICGNVRVASHDIGAVDITALPVELVFFKATATLAGHLLTWQTSSEEINKGFEVQRSTDAENWEAIGFVAGAGTTVEVQDYEYTDTDPLMGNSYYRLKQIDYDGAFEYSNVVNIEYSPDSYRNRNKEYRIFPNPVTDNLNLQGITAGQVTIYNTLGQPLRTIQITNDNTQISMTDLPSGQYFLEVLSADGVRFNELIIKN